MWLLAACAVLGAETPSYSKPHVVVIYADDLGWGNVGWYVAAAAAAAAAHPLICIDKRQKYCAI